MRNCATSHILPAQHISCFIHKFHFIIQISVLFQIVCTLFAWISCFLLQHYIFNFCFTCLTFIPVGWVFKFYSKVYKKYINSTVDTPVCVIVNKYPNLPSNKTTPIQLYILVHYKIKEIMQHVLYRCGKLTCCLSIYNDLLRVFSYTRLMSTPDSELPQLHGYSIIKHTTGTYTDLCVLTGMKIVYSIHRTL